MKFNKNAFMLFLILSLTYAYFFQDAMANGNSRLGLTFAIVQEGRLAIDSFHDKVGTFTDEKALFQGHYYTDKAIGSSLIASIFYFPLYKLSTIFNFQIKLRLIKHILTFCSIGLLSAFTGSLIFLLCDFISINKFWSYIVSIALCLGTMSFPYTIAFFGHQIAAGLLFFAFILIFQQKINSGKNGVFSLFIIGFLLGLTLITEYTSILIVFPLCLYYFFVIIKYKTIRLMSYLILPTLGGLLPLIIMFLYNYVCFGTPFSIGYTYENSEYFRESMSSGLMGIHWPSLKILYYETIFPAKGLFWQSPILILSIVGLFYLFQHKEYWVEGFITIFALCAYFLVNSGYYAWSGGWSFGIRGIIPMLPFLSIPLMFLPKRYHILAIALTTISVFQMLVVSASNILVPDDYIAKLDTFKFSSIQQCIVIV